MDLFAINKERVLKREAPLAARMRPDTLDEFVGQTHIIKKGSLLYRAISADKLSSIILYGPPGTGKTTLARVVANTTRGSFVQLNATASGIKDIKATIEQAKDSFSFSGKRTILFIDEIHRFNKTQQDALLPFVEDGTLVLIGATTENPYYEVNKALVSRSIVFEMKPLSKDEVKTLLYRAIGDAEKGLGIFPIDITDEAADFLADRANGDARAALNAAELAALTTEPNESGRLVIDLETASECIQKRVLLYERAGDNHYDIISAFIKSMRGSDPDAAIYYMARMLYAGEDPKFIARRMVICASEDVGNADPRALQVAVAAMQAVECIGLPECKINMAQAAAYIACAPKSNASCQAIFKAWDDVAKVQVKALPPYLRDSSHASLAKSRGGEAGETPDYLYSHAYPGNYVPQQYLPDELKDRVYYEPTDNGSERKIKEALARLRPERPYG
ncbi:MAG: replication-associated recombination protein A [Defluviitaleaceae bacterium]|nr:replication-associated recombination protein A [Defluviitaleaceae bacterium]